MREERDPSHTEFQRLAQSWYRAELMHEHLHTLKGAFEPNLSKIERDAWWEFRTYLDYWLSGLFVFVEGFNKLKIEDSKVERLFNENIRTLKRIRHDADHFTVDRAAPSGAPEFRFDHNQMNCAEELPEAFRVHLSKITDERAEAEKVDLKDQRGKVSC